MPNYLNQKIDWQGKLQTPLMEAWCTNVDRVIFDLLGNGDSKTELLESIGGIAQGQPNVEVVTPSSPILGHRVLAINSSNLYEYASADNLSQLGLVRGINPSASISGEAIHLATTGEVVYESGWSWSPGPVFLGFGGFLTQVEPEYPLSLFSQVVGVAISPTTILVQLELPIELG